MELYRYHREDLAAIAKSVQEFSKGELVQAMPPDLREFPLATFRKMGEMGFLGAAIPEFYGGAGWNLQTFAVIMEGIARYSGSAALILTAHHSLAAAQILYGGSEEQKRQWLPQLSDGTAIGAWCLTEPGAGSDAFGSMRTSAVRTHDGWAISGEKTFITNGLVADQFIVLAKERKDPNERQGRMRAFVLPRECVETSSVGEKMGMHATATASVTISAAVSNGALLEGDGRTTAFTVLNRGRVGIAALACGLMRGALEDAIAYTKQRKQFGRPIAEFQGVSFPLAESYAALLASWELTMRAAQLADDDKLEPAFSAAAKLFATTTSLQVCRVALEAMGGIGYTEDSRMPSRYADAQLLPIGEGTSNMQRIVIARDLLNRN